MIKRCFSLILAVLMLSFAGCSNSEQTEIKEKLNTALATVNGETRLDCDYMLELTFDGGKVLYYAKGNSRWDREKERLSTVYDRNYLGNAVRMESYLADGAMFSLVDKIPVKIDSVGGDMFAQFPQFQIPNVGEGEITLANNSAGTAYKFVPDDAEALCEAIVGDIYGIAQVIKVPQRDKTEYTNAQCVYTLKDGGFVSARFEMDVKLFDAPNGSKNEEDYTLELKVVAKIEYNRFGEDVVIREYAPEESEPEEGDVSDNSEKENIDKSE